MNETMVTVAGNVATEVEYRETKAGVPSVRFRFAVTASRFDSERGGWTETNTSFYTVWAWRALAANLKASVSRGEPLLVQGRLRIREYENEGKRYTDPTIDAVAVGHDLTRGTSAFRRVVKAQPIDEHLGQGAPAALG